MTEPIIDIRHLSFHYPDGREALHDISFSVDADEKVALIGANGSGKSTLLLHLNGILRAKAGDILINGLHLGDKTIGQIRAWVGMLFQNPDDQLFSTIVADDVAFAPRYMGLPEAEIQGRVERALAMVDMTDYATRLSYHLSMGEKKRIAIATVLTMDTRILALDEPLAGLDPRGRRNFMQLLKTFTDQTMLITTHDMFLVTELCTRVIVLAEGRLVAEGATEDIVYNRDLMEQYGLEVPRC